MVLNTAIFAAFGSATSDRGSIIAGPGAQNVGSTCTGAGTPTPLFNGADNEGAIGVSVGATSGSGATSDGETSCSGATYGSGAKSITVGSGATTGSGGGASGSSTGETPMRNSSSVTA